MAGYKTRCSASAVHKAMRIQLCLPGSDNLNSGPPFTCSPSLQHVLLLAQILPCELMSNTISILGIPVVPVYLLMEDSSSHRTIWHLEENTCKKSKSRSSIKLSQLSNCSGLKGLRGRNVNHWSWKEGAGERKQVCPCPAPL